MEAVRQSGIDQRNVGGLLALVVGVSLVSSIWRAIDPLLAAWSQQEYSHAWFILPLAALVFLQRFRTAELGGSKAPGALAVGLSVGIMFFAWATGSYTACMYGALVGVVGFIWASLGTKAIKTLGAPLIYLFFMVPLPVALYISTSAEMQLWSSRLGMVLISLFQVPASLDGNIIVLSAAKLEVAEACNGLRYLFPLISFAFLTSMLIEDRFWKKAFIVASSFPIAIIMNAARIALIAVLLERFNIDTSTGPAHDFEGFAVFFLCILLLFVEVWLLLGIGASRGRFRMFDLVILDRNVVQRLYAWPISRTSMVAGALLVAASCFFASLPARTEIVPPRQPFAIFPMSFEGWHGTAQTLDTETIGALGLTDYLVADFVNEGADLAQSLNFYVAYYASQRAGVHAHSPQLCIPGGGWSIISQSIVSLPMFAGGTIDANRVVIEKNGMRQVVYYWFQERGRHIASESVLKYYALRDALVDNRSDGALVRIVAPIVADRESVVDEMVTRFVADTASLLQPHFPNQIAH